MFSHTDKIVTLLTVPHKTITIENIPKLFLVIFLLRWSVLDVDLAFALNSLAPPLCSLNAPSMLFRWLPVLSRCSLDTYLCLRTI